MARFSWAPCGRTRRLAGAVSSPQLSDEPDADGRNLIRTPGEISVKGPRRQNPSDRPAGEVARSVVSGRFDESVVFLFRPALAQHDVRACAFDNNKRTQTAIGTMCMSCAPVAAAGRISKSRCVERAVERTGSTKSPALTSELMAIPLCSQGFAWIRPSAVVCAL